MIIFATFQHRHALNLVLPFVAAFSSTNSVNLEASKWANPGKSVEKLCVSGEELDSALLALSPPRICLTDLENLWKEPQDQPYYTTHQAHSDIIVKDHTPVLHPPSLHSIQIPASSHPSDPFTCNTFIPASGYEDEPEGPVEFTWQDFLSEDPGAKNLLKEPQLDQPYYTTHQAHSDIIVKDHTPVLHPPSLHSIPIPASSHPSDTFTCNTLSPASGHEDQPDGPVEFTWEDFFSEDPGAPLSPKFPSKLHASENRITPLSSSSSKFNPSSISPRESHMISPTHDLIHKDTACSHQAPQTDGNPFQRINQNIPRGDTKEVGQLCGIEPSSSQFGNDVNPHLSSEKSSKRSADEFLGPENKVTDGIGKHLSRPKKKPAAEYRSQEDTSNDRCSGDSIIGRYNSVISEHSLINRFKSLLVLKERYDRFCTKYYSDFGTRPPSVLHPAIRHPKLRLGLFWGKKSPAVIKILKSSGNVAMDPKRVFTQYYHLIRVIYSLSDEYLNTCEIPTFMYHIWHNNILDWVDDEMSRSDLESCPIIGINRSLKVEWETAYEYREPQVKLIEYYSQTGEIHAVPTAKYLLERFKANNKKHALLGQLSFRTEYLEENLNISPSPNFKQNIKGLLELVINKRVFSDLISNSRYKIEGAIPTITPLSEFKTHLERLRGNLQSKFQSIHPKLPITTYFQEFNSNNVILHVLKFEKLTSTIVDPKLTYKKLRTLLRAINYIHYKFHKHSNSTKIDYEESTNQIYDRLIETLIRQNISPPLFGYYTTEENLAPWEGEKNRHWKGFPPLKMQLIRYFSEEDDPLILEKTAEFAYIDLLEEHHPERLTNIQGSINTQFRF